MNCGATSLCDNNEVPLCIIKLFTEFVKHCNVWLQFRDVLSKHENETVAVESKNNGYIKGAEQLYTFLTTKLNWFGTMLEKLRHPEVKLHHVADLMEEEVIYCKILSQGRSGNSEIGGISDSAKTPAALYMEYNSLLEKSICDLFTKYIKPEKHLHIFNKYSNKVLTKSDMENVIAELNRQGDLAAAIILLERLVLYQDWFKVLQQVLVDPDVKLHHVADEMSKVTLSIKESYEKEKKKFQTYSGEISRENVIPKQAVTDLPGSAQVFAKVESRPLLNSAQGRDQVMTIPSFQKPSREQYERDSADPASVAAPMKTRLLNSAQGRAPARTRPLLRGSSGDQYESDSAEMKIGAHILSQSCEMPESDRDFPAPAGYSVDIVDESGKTELMIAAACGNKTELMIAAACGNKTELMNAAACGNKTELMIAAACGNKTELMIAAACGNKEHLVFLISNTSDIDKPDKKGRTALMYAANTGQVACLELLIVNRCDVDKTDVRGNNALFIAAGNGKHECVKSLIYARASFDVANISGATALMIASERGYVECVRLLLKAGCDPDKRHKDGRTALIYAAIYNHLGCIKLLIEHYCDVNIADDMGVTALIYAAKNGYSDCLELLIDGGADVNKIGKEGNSAIMWAIVCKHVQCKNVELLIKNKANLKIVNESGYTPLKTAKVAKCKNCKRLIKKAIAALQV